MPIMSTTKVHGTVAGSGQGSVESQLILSLEYEESASNMISRLFLLFACTFGTQYD